MTDKINLLNLNQKELEDLVISLGMKKFYRKQIFNWLHKKIVRDLNEITNLSLKDRELLGEKAPVNEGRTGGQPELLDHPKGHPEMPPSMWGKKTPKNLKKISYSPWHGLFNKVIKHVALIMGLKQIHFGGIHLGSVDG